MSSEVFVSEPVEQVLQLYDGLVDDRAWGRTAREQLERLAGRLLEGHGSRLAGAAVELHNWFPAAGAQSAHELLDLPLSIADAHDTVSRAHGFSAWSAAASGGLGRGDAVFERAVEAVLGGDITGLVAMLASAPDLVTRRSHYGHGATLLHYLAANGVETYRQRVPRNAAKLALLLLQGGANPGATAKMYGADLTTRALLLSSSHPSEAGVKGELLAVLDASGAA